MQAAPRQAVAPFPAHSNYQLNKLEAEAYLNSKHAAVLGGFPLGTFTFDQPGASLNLAWACLAADDAVRQELPAAATLPEDQRAEALVRAVQARVERLLGKQSRACSSADRLISGLRASIFCALHVEKFQKRAAAGLPGVSPDTSGTDILLQEATPRPGARLAYGSAGMLARRLAKSGVLAPGGLFACPLAHELMLDFEGADACHSEAELLLKWKGLADKGAAAALGCACLAMSLSTLQTDSLGLFSRALSTPPLFHAKLSKPLERVKLVLKYMDPTIFAIKIDGTRQVHAGALQVNRMLRTVLKVAAGPEWARIEPDINGACNKAILAAHEANQARLQKMGDEVAALRLQQEAAAATAATKAALAEERDLDVQRTLRQFKNFAVAAGGAGFFEQADEGQAAAPPARLQYGGGDSADEEVAHPAAIDPNASVGALSTRLRAMQLGPAALPAPPARKPPARKAAVAAPEEHPAAPRRRQVHPRPEPAAAVLPEAEAASEAAAPRRAARERHRGAQVAEQAPQPPSHAQTRRSNRGGQPEAKAADPPAPQPAKRNLRSSNQAAPPADAAMAKPATNRRWVR